MKARLVVPLALGGVLTILILLWAYQDEPSPENNVPDVPAQPVVPSTSPASNDLIDPCLEPVPDGMDLVSLTKERIALTSDYLQGLIADGIHWQELDLIVDAVELPLQVKEELVISSIKLDLPLIDPDSPIHEFTEATEEERRYLDSILHSTEWRKRLDSLPKDSDRKIYSTGTLYSHFLLRSSGQTTSKIVSGLLELGFKPSQTDISGAVFKRLEPSVIMMMIDKVNNTKAEVSSVLKGMPTVAMTMVYANRPLLLKYWLDKVPDSGLEDYGINELDLQAIPFPGAEDEALEVVKVLLDAGRTYSTLIGHRKLETWTRIQNTDRIHPPAHEVNADIQPAFDSLESLLGDNTVQLKAAVDRKQECQSEPADKMALSTNQEQQDIAGLNAIQNPLALMDSLFDRIVEELFQGLGDPEFVKDFQAAIRQKNWPGLLEQVSKIHDSEVGPVALSLVMNKALSAGISEDVLDDFLAAGAQMPEDAITLIAASRQYEMLDMLIDRGANTGGVSVFGMNALGMVAAGGDNSASARAFFKRLIVLGVDVNSDTEALDPLHYALNSPFKEGAAYYTSVLLKNGATFGDTHQGQLDEIRRTNLSKYNYLISTVPEFAIFLPEKDSRVAE